MPGKSRQTSNGGDANWDKLLPGAGSDLDAACGRRKGKQAHPCSPGGTQGDPCSAEELPLLLQHEPSLTVVNC